MEAKIIQQTSPEDAYKRLEEMAAKQIDTLRKLTKEVSETKFQAAVALYS
jgi:tetratricopeptide repeat protein 30